MRIATAAGSALSGRLLLNSLPNSDSDIAGTLTGAKIADRARAGAAPLPGPPAVAVSDEGGAEGSLRLAYLAGAQPEQVGLNEEGDLIGYPTTPGPPGSPGSAAVIAVDPQGGGVLAYPTVDGAGREAVAVRQDFPSGSAQTALVAGRQDGPVADLAIGRSGRGDALIAFRQGEPGRYQVVAEWVGAPPSRFRILTPPRWRKPRQVRLHWEEAKSAVGEVTYAVLIDGRRLRSGLKRRRLRLRPGQLGNGVRHARVVATDALGQQLLTPVARLRIDGQPPTVRVRRLSGHRVSVRVSDPGAGLNRKATAVRFGDGARDRRSSSFRHRYARGGSFRIVVRARDRAGNRVLRRLRVRVP
jgi:hypothetical protein